MTTETMRALVQLHDGYSGRQEGPQIDRLEPYVMMQEIAVPEPGPGKVLIKVAMAAINPSDLHFIKGEYGQPRRKGVPAGFEGVGTVASGNGAYAESLVGKRGRLHGRS
ncbi:alcohol dehydrogenase catalytic domain-containing protein [Rhizobium alvei]|uniref:Alcohol dehydrogenase catalytic domain-containing protein n=1 Tax=Rhizobium alvei TaxID=1132659 RepID=A0ABT8YNU4_9HYPH|nr:alcohol dehydrogenase catalytic domain-containing protein [Rhizobium alvei]MDO6965367.1 alcohol dehydrogenase catalytic domain-containing protein [Rhizobium alvei]